MPVESVVILAVIVLTFAIFASALAFAQYSTQTRIVHEPEAVSSTNTLPDDLRRAA